MIFLIFVLWLISTSTDTQQRWHFDSRQNAQILHMLTEVPKWQNNKLTLINRFNRKYMILKWRHLWCNHYCYKKTKQIKIKKMDSTSRVPSWTRQFAFHIVLILFRKVSIKVFSLQLWVNNRADWVINFDKETSLEEINSNQIWRGMGSVRLFLSKTFYMSSTPIAKPGYRTSESMRYDLGMPFVCKEILYFVRFKSSWTQ